NDETINVKIVTNCANRWRLCFSPPSDICYFSQENSQPPSLKHSPKINATIFNQITPFVEWNIANQMASVIFLK
ncbi:hypothetical protein, partial [Serratia sp. CY43514]|uniref:hypothetical protein n=1 Tax=Serratia sp. CY43514 TaxID=3383620 RepID=UPI0040271DF8